jgi:two-component system, chemotaxis family, chemotaxis protein CheY
MKSLVVDDDVTSRLILDEILAVHGPVDPAGDGAEAVDMVSRALDQGQPYNLICMDLQMPSLNGLEAIQLIRLHEERRGVPHTARIVVITGSEDVSTIDAAFRQLADAYIVKPVDGEALLNIVGCLCGVG